MICAHLRKNFPCFFNRVRLSANRRCWTSHYQANRGYLSNFLQMIFQDPEDLVYRREQASCAESENSSAVLFLSYAAIFDIWKDVFFVLLHGMKPANSWSRVCRYEPLMKQRLLIFLRNFLFPVEFRSHWRNLLSTLRCTVMYWTRHFFSVKAYSERPLNGKITISSHSAHMTS